MDDFKSDLEADGDVMPAYRPGGSLDGFTEETFASSRSVLDATRGGRKGLQQFFTPPDASLFIHSVVNPKGLLRAFDPTAGDGSLLWPHKHRFGVELHEPTLKESARVILMPDDPRISYSGTSDLSAGVKHLRDGRVAADQSYTAVRGDIQHVYPLLRVSGARFSAVVANPPFGLNWQIGSLNDGSPASSTLLTWLVCQKLAMPGAQGAFICGSDRLRREILGMAEASSGIYAIVDLASLFDGVDLPCSIVFWAWPDARRAAEPPITLAALGAKGLAPLACLVVETRDRVFTGLLHADRTDQDEAGRGTGDVFAAIQATYRRRIDERLPKARHDILLAGGGRIEVHPSPLAILAMERQGGLGASMSFLRSLHGQRVNYFALNTRDWRRIQSLVDSEMITISGDDRANIDAIVAEAQAAACPMYPIEPQQRLAYIQDMEQLTCTVGDPERGYLAGQSYSVDVSTEIETRERTEVKNQAGELKTYTFRADFKALKIMVGGDKPRRYSETKEDIDYLVEHFDIPDPGDVSTRYPNAIEKWRMVIRNVHERRMVPGVSARPFQVEDIARLVFKGSGVLSWEQGGGKTFGSMLAVSALEEAGRADGNVLFIVPQDLIPQWRSECRAFFGRELIHITSRSQARAIQRGIKAGALAPAWYVTHYEALAIEGLRVNAILTLERIERGLFITKPKRVAFTKGKARMDEEVIGRKAVLSQADGSDPQNEAADLTTGDACPRCSESEAEGRWNGYHCKRCGETRSHLTLKPIAHGLATAFKKGCIVVDEGTKIKADDSLTSLAVRGLRARHRILLTGTPQKNYVFDLFHLLSWTLGPASVRFPFAWGSEGKSKFEADFCVVERLVGGKRRRVLPEVTNLSVLWRLLSGAIVRRRKENMGEPIVERTFLPVTVPFGTNQRLQYKPLAPRLYGLVHGDPLGAKR